MTDIGRLKGWTLRLGTGFAPLLAFLLAFPFFSEAQSGERVEIVIRDSSYEFSGGILKPDVPATIVLKNMDDITHGFTSSLLGELQVRVETEAAVAFGREIEKVHVYAGKSVMIHFTPTRSGKYTFRCDLHPEMKGELLSLSVGAT